MEPPPIDLRRRQGARYRFVVDKRPLPDVRVLAKSIDEASQDGASATRPTARMGPPAPGPLRPA